MREIEELLGKVSTSMINNLNNPKCLKSLLLGPSKNLSKVECFYDLQSGESSNFCIPFCDSEVFLNEILFSLIIDSKDKGFNTNGLIDDVYTLATSSDSCFYESLYDGAIKRLKKINNESLNELKESFYR